MFENNFNITEALRNFFGWKMNNVEITVFSLWHIGYILVIGALIVLGALLLKGRTQSTKRKVLNVLAITTLCLYIFDFFVQPFMRSNFTLNIDKLPFHICTIMGIVAVFAQFSKRSWFKETAVVLASVGSIMYLTYPGSALGEVSPVCYQVVQTMLYHGMLLAWGVLSLTTGEVKLNMKHIWYPLVGLCAICAWAMLGNICFNGGGHWDWFFITGSMFDFVSANILPLLVIAATYAVACLIYLIYWLATPKKKKQK
ncbi:MAG: YwaF family protein [Clostridia bacterium]|nr:YwaF family protein [Clostridia bacterium]